MSSLYQLYRGGRSPGAFCKGVFERKPAHSQFDYRVDGKGSLETVTWQSLMNELSERYGVSPDGLVVGEFCSDDFAHGHDRSVGRCFVGLAHSASAARTHLCSQSHRLRGTLVALFPWAFEGTWAGFVHRHCLWFSRRAGRLGGWLAQRQLGSSKCLLGFNGNGIDCKPGCL